MNLFKEYYLRLIKGYTKMYDTDKAIIQIWFLCSEKQPEFIRVKNYWLVSPPK